MSNAPAASLAWPRWRLLLVLAACIVPLQAQASIRVVAAESSYGSMVKSIGGDHVQVHSLLDSPDVSPNVFEAAPRSGRLVAEADLVVMNGLGFDAWMDKLLAGTPNPRRHLVKASQAASGLVMRNGNWHLFYSPRAMLATASRVATELQRLDPAHTADYQAHLQAFEQRLQAVYAQVQRLIAEHPDLDVSATVPVYGYMFRLLGYRVHDQAVQFALMNGSQPGARQVSHFVQGLQHHHVHLLVYNKQVQNRLTRMLIQTARDAGVAVVGVSAIPLHGQDYVQWQVDQLQAIEHALEHTSP